MSKYNETVEQVVGEFKTSRHTCKNCDFEVCPSIIVFADRIIAAHNREIDAIAAQKTAEAHEAFVKNAELAKAIAAKDRQLEAASADAEAADAEIDKLKFDNLHLKSVQRQAGEVIIEQTNKVAAKDAEIARLRALVEGLLDASTVTCADCRYDCGPNRENCIVHEAANYINKAREVVK